MHSGRADVMGGQPQTASAGGLAQSYHYTGSRFAFLMHRLRFLLPFGCFLHLFLAGVVALGGSGPAGSGVVVPGGACELIVKLAVSAEGSKLPAPSLARTVIVWGPSASGPNVAGDQQVRGGPPSTAQVKSPTPGSVLWKLSVGVLSLVVPEGAESMTVSGGTVSMVKVM